MKNIYELINKEILVREPVDEICDRIINSRNKKIILTGGRGVGKSVVLSALENRCLGTKNECINIHFDAAGMGSNFEEQFYIHYYELIFSNKLLHYIKQNYTITYNRYFNKYDNIISDYFEELNNYVNNCLYEDIEIKKYLNTGELSNKILNKLKEVLKLETLTLAIDRFDWTLNRNPIAQVVLSKYFNMFDKTVITSDDENLKEKYGYSIINIDYCKDVEIVKLILIKHMLGYNTGKKDKFPFELIPTEKYFQLINKTNGNIKLMLEIMSEVIRDWEWCSRESFTIAEEIDKEMKYKVKHFEELKMMSSRTILHL